VVDQFIDEEYFDPNAKNMQDLSIILEEPEEIRLEEERAEGIKNFDEEMIELGLDYFKELLFEKYTTTIKDMEKIKLINWE